MSSQGRGEGAHPLHPPPRSAPVSFKKFDCIQLSHTYWDFTTLQYEGICITRTSDKKILLLLYHYYRVQRFLHFNRI